ncbi:hypothetical protein CANCADRAFT_30559 [Tortispora caseinolytica NRRL Y-17796]|uniref:P-type Na(+) transporter n=1 Tax=Tortispora caseinolytica NRRL Y-17796 TaxID=767744 RepID=A0A1E4TKW8_9ASCO|nr:hypothetical protein CANCADRAFT_30559 [Tortispora caseinolytica NRRL Y-17796]
MGDDATTSVKFHGSKHPERPAAETNGTSDSASTYSNSTSTRKFSQLSSAEPEAPQTPGPNDYYCWSVDDLVKEFKTDIENGLSPAEAKERLNIYGQNQLDASGGSSAWQILLAQVVNAMTLVLVIAMAISFGIRDWISGGVIAAVILINIVVGFYQEFNAEKIMDSLKSLSSPTAHVIRNGDSMVVPSMELVPGDICQVKVGDTVPADIRIFASMNFEADEALLTGESLPVAKHCDLVFDKVVPVGDRTNMAFSSSIATKGRATGIVVGTGMKTEIGKIAESLSGKRQRMRPVEPDESGRIRKRDRSKAFCYSMSDEIGRFLGLNVGTPLHRKLSKLAIYLFFVAVVFAIVVMAANKFHVTSAVAIYAIATALSMIPASLVVVLTITMAVGTKAMVRRNVIVRKLDSLEALGAVNDICSDKTGTLTQGKMVLRRMWVPGHGTYQISDTTEPYNPTIGSTVFAPKDPHDIAKEARDNDGKVDYDEVPDEKHPRFISFLNSASLANIAVIRQDKETLEWKANGDPTEIAIQVGAHRMDWARSRWTEGDDARYTLLSEFPFDSSIKRMSTIYKDNQYGSSPQDGLGFGEYRIFTKGAVERVLECCTHWYGCEYGQDDMSRHPLTEEEHKIILNQMEAMASEGLRVLSFAEGNWNYTGTENWNEIPRDKVECDLTFLGLVGIYDPPRLESAGAVAKCHHAGINVHMLTGDHPGTAKAIAKEVGIVPKDIHNYSREVVNAMVMTAPQFDALTDDEIDDLPVLPLVIARCAPQTKVRMIEALHRRKMFAAMTGDGVNDSPSLKKADVGIAMGMAGSDVAKSASDIVLTDDNFASILNAIEEGRRMSDNIQKFVLHLLGGNVAQALYLLCGLAFQDKDGLSVFPLSPVEVLWVIMITSSFPAMGLGAEPAAPDVMDKPPKDARVGVFTWEVIVDMFSFGIIIGGICLVSFVILIYGFGDGNLGSNCNQEYSDACKLVFEARSATFVELTGCMLLLAWEVVHPRRSFFRMNPDTTTPWKQPFYDIWRNQFLFWSIILGFCSLFITIYVPVINEIVFMHSPIGWQWAVAIIGLIVFVILAELYKATKRFVFRRYIKDEMAHDPTDDLEQGAITPFSQYMSIAKSFDKSAVPAAKDVPSGPLVGEKMV